MVVVYNNLMQLKKCDVYSYLKTASHSNRKTFGFAENYVYKQIFWLHFRLYYSKMVPPFIIVCDYREYYV